MSSANSPAVLRNSVIRIVVAAVILGSIYGVYANYVANSKKIKELSKAAFKIVSADQFEEYNKAGKMLDEALAIRATEPFPLAKRAEIAAIQSFDHGVAAELPLAHELSAKSVEKDIQFPDRFSAENLVLIADGKLDEAETKLTKLAEAGGAVAPIISALGTVHLRQGKVDVAKNDFKQAADRDWRSPRFSYLYAQSLFISGDFPVAQNTFRKGMEISSTHIGSNIGFARASAAKNEDLEKANESLTTALSLSAEQLSTPFKGFALAGKSEVAFALGDFANAEKFATEAIAVAPIGDPMTAFAHYDLGLALAAQKKEGALAAFQKAISSYQYVSRFYFTAGLALAQAGKIPEGEMLFADYLTKGLPKNDLYFVAHGDFLKSTGDLEKAALEYDEALKLTETNADAFFKKGLVLQEQGIALKGDKTKLFNGALEMYEKALAVRSRFPEVHRQIGLIYLDRKPSSAEALESFVKAIQGYKEAKAPAKVLADFITEVEQRYLTAKLKANAEAWKKEATEMAQ